MNKVVGSNPVHLVLIRKGRDILTARIQKRLSEHTGKTTLCKTRREASAGRLQAANSSISDSGLQNSGIKFPVCGILLMTAQADIPKKAIS